MTSIRSQYSIRFMLALVLASAAVLFAFLNFPGWSVFVICCAPLLLGLYLLFRRSSQMPARILAIPILLFSILLLSIASIGPVSWFFARTDSGAAKVEKMYAPLLPIAASPIVKPAYEGYMKLWAGEPETLPADYFYNK